ncbi:dual specificity protein phosphatase family protein [Shewanella intestini]|uniref:Protein phosphatase n=1 Tax=Shewanella intestini TaxID=2017544 RepID=A0ABS5I098_9GAMM|nr:MULTISPECIES: dual specificity protein phosphatase family protein [Shewanella]MBR9727441.1 protein phosphatase [Shewanella intestini]MRG35509.1 protein phosphatase [Shewanella sp. XMDDZSB0408]
MKHVFWLKEGLIAGRCGPSEQTWNLQELKSAGFSAIASLNDAQQCDTQQMDSLAIEHQVFNLPNNVPPKPEDLAHYAKVLPSILTFIQQQEQANKPVLLHCKTGVNRTELVMAYYLMVNGAAPVHAVSQARLASGHAFDAQGWDQFVYDVLYELQ